MVRERAPFLVRALPTKAKQQLALDYELESFLCGPSSERYLDWVPKYESVVAELLTYKPTPTQLKKTVAPVLARDDDFGSHLLTKGIVDWDRDRELVKKLAHAAAAILVTRYYDVRHNDGS
jgi:hypothetical protein